MSLEKFEKAKDAIMKRHICLDLEGEEYDVFVTIPVLADENIFETIESLTRARTSSKRVCIFVLVNEPHNAPEETQEKNLRIYETLKGKRDISENIQLSVRYITNVPRKIAGVGFARRLLMDEIICHLRRTEKKGDNRNTGYFEKIMISLDSDCTVSENYFEVLDLVVDFGIYMFSHRFSKVPEVYEGGMVWELFLRYWRNALRTFGYTFSFYPIGSLFAFRPHLYVTTGGMTTRKGGEDFYFLQKALPTFSVRDLPAYVFPKAEPSDRTPFGTGKEIQMYVSGQKERIRKTWKLEAFEQIGGIFQNADLKNDVFGGFLKENEKYKEQLARIQMMSKDSDDFTNKFRAWLNPFKVLRFLRFSEKFFGRGPIEDEAGKLINRIAGPEKLNLPETEKTQNPKEHELTERVSRLLEFLRSWDESNPHILEHGRRRR